MAVFFIIIVLIYCFYLHRKIDTLSKKIDNGISNTNRDNVTTAVTATTQQNLTPAQANTAALSTAASLPTFTPTTSNQNNPTSKPDAMSDLMHWLSTDWLLKLGAFLLILGIGWFINYAFAENWIGPVGRISLGLVAGVVILLFGEWWNKRSPLQATIFMVVGLTTILLTTYAARTVYDFFTPLSATLLMGAATVAIAYSSVLHKIESRAIVALAFAGLVPFLTASVEPSVIGLLTYGFVVIVGNLWIVSITGWRRLSAFALVVYGIYSLLSMFSFTSEDIFLLRVIVLSFTLLFYAAGLITHLKVRVPSAADYILSLGNAFLMILWIHQVESEHLASVLTCMGALAFFSGAYLLFKESSKPLVVLEYTAVALVLLASAATFELDGPVLTITYSLLVCTGVFLTQAITQKAKHAQMAGMLLLPVFFHSLISSRLMSNSYSDLDSSGATDYLISWWALAIELGALGYYFYKQGKAANDKDIITNSAIYLIGGLALGLWAFWDTVSYMVRSADTAHAISLVVFTCIGLGLYVYGRLTLHKKTMYSGAGVLGFVVIRLLIVEVWTMDLFQRVIIFTMIGILLMCTAFIKPQKKESTS